MTLFRHISAALFVVSLSAYGASEELLVVPGLHGHPGGKLVFAQRTEPRTLNPVMATDAASREVIQRLMSDLIHINRETLKTEPALAKSWKISADGLHYVLELRQGVRFSDGVAFDADDVVFTFQVFLDEKVNSSQRDLLMLDGKPISVHKLDTYRVAVDLSNAYSVPDGRRRHRPANLASHFRRERFRRRVRTPRGQLPMIMFPSVRRAFTSATPAVSLQAVPFASSAPVPRNGLTRSA